MDHLILDRVEHRYHERVALKGIDCAVSAGVTALLGVNGAGKTTLLSIAAGALRPSAGRVVVEGNNPYGLSGRSRALRCVALMPQATQFPGSMTVLEVVQYLTWMRGKRSREARLAAMDALNRVRLADRAHCKIRALSGGMLRRLSLAQAVASGARTLLLDEPSTGLDPEPPRV